MRRVLVAALGCVVAMSSVAWSQSSTTALVLTYPVSARSAGMGETGVADNSDAANIYYNPANVVGRARVYAQGSRWDLAPIFADDLWIGGGSVGVSYARRDANSFVWSADVSYGRIDYGESIVTLPNGQPLGTAHTVENYIAITIGAGIAFGDRSELRVGVAAKRWDPDYPPDEFTIPGAPEDVIGYAFDAGATYVLRASVAEWNVTPAVALAIVNAGPDVEYDSGNEDPLPTRFHFGTSVRIEGPTVHVLSASVPLIALVYNLEGVERFHKERFSWGIGGEVAVAQIMFVRAGVSDFDDEDDQFDDEDESGWGFGLGVPAGSFRARFDYTKTSRYYEEEKLGFELAWLL
jgi:hypothetical protein